MKIAPFNLEGVVYPTDNHAHLHKIIIFMASPRRSKSIEDLYTRILRVKRKQILMELPDTKELLKDARLEKIFTRSEKIEMVSQRTQSDNAEKMIRALEFKGYDSYKIFIAVLEDYRPSLAHKLSTAAEEIQRMNSGGDSTGSTIINDLRPSSNNNSITGTCQIILPASLREECGQMIKTVIFRTIGNSQYLRTMMYIIIIILCVSRPHPLACQLHY